MPDRSCRVNVRNFGAIAGSNSRWRQRQAWECSSVQAAEFVGEGSEYF